MQMLASELPNNMELYLMNCLLLIICYIKKIPRTDSQDLLLTINEIKPSFVHADTIEQMLIVIDT